MTILSTKNLLIFFPLSVLVFFLLSKNRILSKVRHVCLSESINDNTFLCGQMFKKLFLSYLLTKWLWACVNQKISFHSYRYLMIKIFQWSCYLLSGGEVGNCQRCDAGWVSVRGSTVGPHYRLVTLVESVVWLVLVAQLYRPWSQLTGQRGQLGVVEAVSAQ